MSQLIASQQGIEELADELRKHEVIAYDTEFIRESTFFPELAILQIATRERTWLVDILAFTGRKRKSQTREEVPEGLHPLLEIFEDQKILKVVHAAQGDQEAIYTNLGTLAEPLFDTAIGAALTGYGDGIGLANLAKSVLDVRLKKGNARTNWMLRPLPDQLLDYARSDVVHLVKLSERLLNELDGLGRRDWALELSAAFADSKLYEPDPDGIIEKLSKNGKVDQKSYPVLVELVRWREARIRETNVPRRWLADDGTLIDLARVRPKSLDHLKSFRGLNRGEAKANGELILEVIKKGLGNNSIQMPKRQRLLPPSNEESRSAELLRCFLSILADEKRIALRFLASAQDMLKMIRSRSNTVDELVDEGLLTRGAAELVGSEILAFLKGKRGLIFRGDEVEITEI